MIVSSRFVTNHDTNLPRKKRHRRRLKRMRLLHERKRLAALLRVGNRTGRLRKQRRTTPDVDKVLPETTAWYKMYVSNPKLEQDKFHKTFRNRFRLPYKMMMEMLYLSDIVEHGSWWMEDIYNGHPLFHHLKTRITRTRLDGVNGLSL